MFTINREFVFIEAQEINGISEKTQKPYSLKKITFADPVTFENHVLDFSEKADVRGFSKGDKVKLNAELNKGYRDSRLIVTGVAISK
jgi:hypothetical protein